MIILKKASIFILCSILISPCLGMEGEESNPHKLPNDTQPDFLNENPKRIKLGPQAAIPCYELALLHANGGGVPKDIIVVARCYNNLISKPYKPFNINEPFKINDNKTYQHALYLLISPELTQVCPVMFLSENFLKDHPESWPSLFQMDNLQQAIAFAAPQNHNYAKNQLAIIHKNYQESAEKGDPQAQYVLGKLYEHGYGVPKDLAEAARLFGLAEDQNHFHAQYNRPTA